MTKNKILQGYPQRMRLRKQLYGSYTDCFLIFNNPCNCKLVSFFLQTFKKQLKDYIQSRNLTFGMSWIKSNRSSLQSHILWVNLYIFDITWCVGVPREIALASATCQLRSLLDTLLRD